MAKRWYAVHTLSGSEDTAMRALEQRVAMYGLEGRFGRMLVPSEVVILSLIHISEPTRPY